MLLSVLICSIRKRDVTLKRIVSKLLGQVTDASADSVIEVLVNQDDGELLIGTKRNMLVHQSRGEYICFVDDDDDVSDDYVKKILRAITTERPDCVGIEGRIQFHGHWHTFYHSIRHKKYHRDRPAHKFFRPPNHLNPVRRDIAIRFPFTAKDSGEDSDYAISMLRANALKTEVYVPGPIYIYVPAGELKGRKKPK